MDLVVWIGRRGAPAQLAQMLGAESISLRTFADVASAIADTSGQKVGVAIVTYDAENAPAEVEQLVAAHPEAQVLVASDTGVAQSIALSLWSGASGVLEFRSQTRAEIVQQIRDWVHRHHRVRRERELLLRLRDLNEDFLKHIVTAQKRNLELEEQLRLAASKDADQSAEDEAPRVLIVDDEEVVRGVLQTLLTRRGLQHSAVHTGEAAVQAIEREHFQLVITDKNLPGLSGLDVLQAVKAKSPDTDVIVMTGYASMDSAIEALNLGASAYLEKPFEHVKQVIEKIEAVLERRRERSRHRRYLLAIKERNRSFLDQYRAVRADLEAWLGSLGISGAAAPTELPGSTEGSAEDAEASAEAERARRSLG